MIVKKNIFLICIFVITICLTGCVTTKESFSDFEHSDLSNNDISNNYYYVDDNNYKQEYIITDITSNGSEEILNGLFYKVGENDYILLDKFSSCNSVSAYKSKNQNYFYNNKLYVNRCSGGVVLEYTLDGADTAKKDLLSEFDTTLMLNSIEKVDENYIYYKGSNSYSGPTQVIKCSHKNYNCELLDN